MKKAVWIHAKPDSNEALEVSRLLGESFVKRGLSLNHSYDSDTTAVVIVLGGDGTLLATLRELGEARYEKPFLGIHQSPGLGFLHPIAVPRNSANMQKWSQTVVDCVEQLLLQPENENLRHYRIRQRWGLEATVSPDHQSLWSLNDVVVSKGTLSRMVYLRVRVDGSVLWDKIRGDGLIIASAVGSTAYSLSAGGPVVHPDTAALVLTPICPHEMAQRPVVLGGGAHVLVEVLEGYSGAWITLDGQTGKEIDPGVKIEIKRSPKCIKTLVPLDPSLESKNFYERLRFKLGLGGQRSQN